MDDLVDTYYIDSYDFPYKKRNKNVRLAARFFSAQEKITPIHIQRFVEKQDISGHKKALTENVGEIIGELIQKHGYKVKERDRSLGRQIKPDENRILEKIEGDE